MNFNASTGPRQPLGRKIKRVSDVSAMGYAPYQQQSFSGGSDINNQGYSPSPQGYTNPGMQQLPQQNYGPPSFNNFDMQSSNFQSQGAIPSLGVGVFAQPMVQNMAMQYGQQLATTSTTVMKEEFKKYVPVSKLKYYFAVDTKYVISKLGLLFFPFTHTDWSVKYEQDGPVQPRYELNAPDLYIPTMAYVTYVLVAGLVLGMQQKFSPEQIGIQSSSALAWCLVELAIYSCTLYITNIETSLRTLDLLAYIGYKFVGIIASILLSIVAGKTGYFLLLAYVSLSLAFFLVRTLKAQVLPETTSQTGYYGETSTYGTKRRMYFLLFVALVQPILSWWLSFHLIQNATNIPSST